MLLNYILEVPGSNLGWENKYHHWGFVVFSVHSGTYLDNALNYDKATFLQNPLQFIIHWHAVIWNYTAHVTDSNVK